jgi:hypothetical protein
MHSCMTLSKDNIWKTICLVLQPSVDIGNRARSVDFQLANRCRGTGSSRTHHKALNTVLTATDLVATRETMMQCAMLGLYVAIIVDVNTEERMPMPGVTRAFAHSSARTALPHSDSR